MDVAEARGVAEAELETFSTADNPLQLVDDDAVADIGWGWVFAFSTKRWFETQDAADAPPPGIGPIVVRKDSGAAFSLAAEMPDTAMAPAATPMTIAPRARIRRPVLPSSLRTGSAGSGCSAAAARTPIPSRSAVATSIARRPIRNSESTWTPDRAAERLCPMATSSASCSSVCPRVW